MSEGYRICVIIPAFNEADIIGGTLASVAAELNKLELDFRICVVDDGSGDDTWQAVREASRRLPGRMEGIRFSRNFGKDAAIVAGLGEIKADVYLVMDADGQHPPELIPRFVAEWRRGKVDIVNGIKSGRQHDSRLKRLMSASFNRTFRALSGLDLNQASDFILLSRRAAEAILACGDYSLFFRGLSRWVGFTQTNLFFEVPPRNYGCGKWLPVRLVTYAVNALLLYSNVPLYLIILIGGLALFVSIFLGVKVLVYFFLGEVPSGYSSLILISLISFSSIMTALGCIGLYVKTTLDHVKGRPRYIVMEKFIPPDDL